MSVIVFHSKFLLFRNLLFSFSIFGAERSFSTSFSKIEPVLDHECIFQSPSAVITIFYIVPLLHLLHSPALFPPCPRQCLLTATMTTFFYRPFYNSLFFAMFLAVSVTTIPYISDVKRILNHSHSEYFPLSTSRNTYTDLPTLTVQNGCCSSRYVLPGTFASPPSTERSLSSLQL